MSVFAWALTYIGAATVSYLFMRLLDKLEFRNANGGSIVCRELLGLDKTSKAESPAPSQRTDEYYRKRPCVQIIGEAARIIAGKLAESQTI